VTCPLISLSFSSSGDNTPIFLIFPARQPPYLTSFLHLTSDRLISPMSIPPLSLGIVEPFSASPPSTVLTPFPDSHINPNLSDGRSSSQQPLISILGLDISATSYCCSAQLNPLPRVPCHSPLLLVDHSATVEPDQSEHNP
jgi:hypothetical protein